MLINLSYPLILASGSEVRKIMLEKIGLKFKVIKPKIDEEKLKTKIKHLSFDEQAMFLAKEKGSSVAKDHPDSLVIASDQICEIAGEILSKPGNHKNAVSQLKILSGKKHMQHNAVCLLKGKKLIWQHTETAKLSMRDLTDEEIETYVTLDKPYHSCGSYKFESYGKLLFKEVKGDHDCILGISLIPLLNALRIN